jgi:predicted ATPase
MLTRIYIDNFRCFVNFEYRPAPKQLILGPNGSGKSSLLDALLFLRRVMFLGQDLERREILNQKTLWMDRNLQTWEIEASLDNASYLYHLEINSYGDPPRARILSENVKINGKPIFGFEDGKVHLFDDQSHSMVTYPFDWHRSALATLSEERVNQNLARFKRWFNNLMCFRINPFRMGYRAEREDAYPFFDLSNFAAWYKHLFLSSPQENAKLLESLAAALDGFSFLRFESAGENIGLLFSEFVDSRGSSVKLRFDKLSDGQRCLICLYAILNFVVAKGNTVILDEPENFIALREIQPWLSAVSDAIEENRGQVLIISHHPEFMNQWAPDFGVQFIRDGMGPVRVKEFRTEAYNTLLPSEVIARGWEND